MILRSDSLLAPLVVVCAVACAPSRVAQPFRIAAPYDVSTLDPNAFNTVSSFSLLSNVYEPLVRLDPNMTVTPCLARSWENPDPLTWVFHLRPSVRFHGGGPLRAADVVYTFRRLLDSQVLEMRAYVLSVKEVAALDDATVRIRTDRPLRVLLNKLHFVLIVPEGSTADTLKATANGTGPYRVTSWKAGDDLALLRNPSYWGAGPLLQEVHFALGQPPAEVADGVLAGRYQLTQIDSPALEAKVAASRHLELLRRGNIYVKYAGYDVGRDATPFCSVRPNPFRNPAVRQALNLAVDREALAAGMPNHATPANQPIPRFIFGFDPSLPVPRPDLARARALLAAAGLGSGFEATLHVRSMFAPAASLLRQQWARIGIRLDARILADDPFFEQQSRQQMSLWLTRYGCPTGDAGDILDNVIHSADPGRHFGSQNHGGFSDPQLDAAIEEAEQIEDMGGRRRAVEAVMARTMEALPILPLYFDEDAYALDRRYSWRPRNDSYIRVAEITLR